VKLEDAVLVCLRGLIGLKARRTELEVGGWAVVAYRVPPSTPQGHEILRIDVKPKEAEKDG
jgi:hypothetical protein